MAQDASSFWVPIGASPDVPPGVYALSITLFDAGGAPLETRTSDITVVATDFPVEYLDVPTSGPSGLRTPDEVQQELDLRAAIYARVTPQQLWSGPFTFPLNAAISTAFGTARSYNGGPVSTNHSGTDFAANEGVPVAASAAGRVAYAGMMTTRGLSVIIDHGWGVFTAYHHMSRIDVVEGQAIAQGQIVGAVGMTGLSTGPHLHWELVIGGENVDPTFWTYAGVAP